MDSPGKTPSNWDDLTVRIASSVVMVGMGAVAMVLGGMWFQILVVFVTAVIVWEIWMMMSQDGPTPGMLLAVLVASVMSAQFSYEAPLSFLLFLIAPAVGALVLKRARATFFAFAFFLQIAGWGLVHFRVDFGFVWVLWLILVVVITDVFGYFAGKALGGPKFWPKISPKKTWSGTVAGWLGAALIGAIFMLFTAAGWLIIPLSMLLSFAGQMGDITESALKRRMGVKDSSALIPGHGGLFDRFDALLGAALFMLLITSIFTVPGFAF